MTSLFEFIEDAFQSYRGYHGRYRSVNDFISNNERCLDLIYSLLDIGRDDGKALTKKNFDRASHILITFLLGLGIDSRLKLLDGVNVFNTMPDSYLWMLSSVLHDYGYFRRELLKGTAYENLPLKHDLLTDEYGEEAIRCLNAFSSNHQQFCTFSYGVIRNYYDYRELTLADYSEINGERNDHGIMGACIAFSQYVDFFIKYEYPRIPGRESTTQRLIETEPLLYKTACLTAAQHNMYRSESVKQDEDYRIHGLFPLLSTAPIAINRNNPLLFLLSIVDTIECTKRFSKAENPEKYLQTNTVIKNILIGVDGKTIIIDFSMLHEYILKERKSKKMNAELQKHINGIISIGSWTSAKGKRIDDYKVAISID